MKSVFLLLIFAIIGLGSVHAASDCTKIPPIKVDEVCCKIPEATDRDVLNDCEEDGKTKKFTNGTLACYITDCYLHRAGFIEDDKISLKKMNEYLDKHAEINDTVWLDNFKDACELCVEKAYNDKEEKIRDQFAKLLKANVTVCDPINVFVTTCIQAEVVKNCPSNDFNDTPNCRNIQRFLTDCPDYLITITNWNP